MHFTCPMSDEATNTSKLDSKEQKSKYPVVVVLYRNIEHIENMIENEIVI